MRPQRLWIFGAPGAGTTTLGRALAARMGAPFFDTDDYYWFTDDPLPYRRKRNAQHRLQLLTQDLEGRESFVVAGALLGWGDPLIRRFDAAVYRWLPADVRLTRIQQREAARYGAERIAPGGDLHAVFEKFLRWAEQYDTAPPEKLRSYAAEQQWINTQIHLPLIQSTEDLPPEALAEVVWQRLIAALYR
ncbi:MAG: hypothetical protein RMJ33_01040 [Saprospiraceae bacterium]|nr:hypothetical protein [Saprospiraceae bacterium]MDW8228394.1 hypothetical protein [Saprospiraceae bacterium]